MAPSYFRWRLLVGSIYRGWNGGHRRRRDDQESDGIAGEKIPAGAGRSHWPATAPRPAGRLHAGRNRDSRNFGRHPLLTGRSNHSLRPGKGAEERPHE